MAGNHRKMDRRIKVNGDRSSCDVTWAGLEVREESSIGAIHPTGWRPMTPRSSGGGASASLHQVSKEQDPTPRRRYNGAQRGAANTITAKGNNEVEDTFGTREHYRMTVSPRHLCDDYSYVAQFNSRPVCDLGVEEDANQEQQNTERAGVRVEATGDDRKMQAPLDSPTRRATRRDVPPHDRSRALTPRLEEAARALETYEEGHGSSARSPIRKRRTPQPSGRNTGDPVLASTMADVSSHYTFEDDHGDAHLMHETGQQNGGVSPCNDLCVIEDGEMDCAVSFQSPKFEQGDIIDHLGGMLKRRGKANAPHLSVHRHDESDSDANDDLNEYDHSDHAVDKQHRHTNRRYDLLPAAKCRTDVHQLKHSYEVRPIEVTAAYMENGERCTSRDNDHNGADLDETVQMTPDRIQSVLDDISRKLADLDVQKQDIQTGLHGHSQSSSKRQKLKDNACDYVKLDADVGVRKRILDHCGCGREHFHQTKQTSPSTNAWCAMQNEFSVNAHDPRDHHSSSGAKRAHCVETSKKMQPHTSVSHSCSKGNDRAYDPQRRMVKPERRVSSNLKPSGEPTHPYNSSPSRSRSSSARPSRKYNEVKQEIDGTHTRCSYIQDKVHCGRPHDRSAHSCRDFSPVDSSDNENRHLNKGEDHKDADGVKQRSSCAGRGTTRSGKNIQRQVNRRHDKSDSSPSPRPAESHGRSDNPKPSKAGKSESRTTRKRSISPEATSCETGSVKDQYSRHQNIKPDKFDGSTCVETFLSKFSSCATYNKWHARDKAAHLKACLTGRAGSLLWQNEEATYEQMVEKLRQRYGSREQQEKFRVELKCRRRGASETLQELAHEVERLVTLAYPEAGQPTKDILARDFFIESLDSHALIYKIKEREPATLNSALTMAMKLEVLQKSCDIEKESQKTRHVRVAQAEDSNSRHSYRPSTGNFNADRFNSTGHHNSLRQQLNQQDKELSQLRNELKTVTDELTSLRTQRSTQVSQATPPPWNPPPQMLPQPYYNEMQNIPHGALIYQSPSEQTLVSPGGNQTQRRGTCFACGQPGHYKRNCPNVNAQNGVTSNGQSTTAHARLVTAENNDSAKSYLSVVVHGKRRLCLLDTGCEVTMIPANLVKGSAISETSQRLLAANGTQIPILGWAVLSARIGRHTMQIAGLVSEHIMDVMLGIDWLQENKVCWNFATGEIQLHGQIFQLAEKADEEKWCRRVILAKDVTVPPRAQLDLTTKAIYSQLISEQSADSESWATQSSEMRPGFFVARTVLPNRANDLPVKVVNTNNHPITIGKNSVVSLLEPLSPLTPNAQGCVQNIEEEDELIESLMSKIDDSVTDDVRTRLRAILKRHSNVFSKNEWDLGWTDIVIHKIDTGNSKPIRQQLRRYPPAHNEAIDKHLEDMLQQGIIQPAASPWASNIVLAKKKDGSLRCCIDYRQVNEVTRKDAYPLPRTDACLDAMSGSSIFSTFDMRSGFHQVAMQPEDADKTAFITRRGMFRFKTMPFGLCNATATFQRLMDLVLTGLNLEICLAFVDDIILYSVNEEQHLERLELLLQRLEEVNLKLKPSKCNLMQKSVTFLGHVVSGDGISTDPEKISLIREWPEPATLSQLRGFLGLTGYYRKFVKGYTNIALPLNQLMKKNQRFVWSDGCRVAFQQLKEALTTQPVLALPNDEDTFILDTDAADASIGAVLSQVQSGQERVIAYAGRSLNRNELNYCVTRKELLAVVHFTKYFRQYLLGRKFIIRTDHAALAWLQKTPEPIGQNARWLELLGEYDFKIQHRPGRCHANADAVSRHPCLNKPSCSACHQDVTKFCSAVNVTSEPKSNQVDQLVATAEVHEDIPEGMSWSRQEIAEAQQEDADIGIIIKCMKRSAVKPEWNEVEVQSANTKVLWHEWERLVLHENILLRRWTSIDPFPHYTQIVLPRKYRSEFIRMAHEGMVGGHLGRSKTEDQVRRRAYWPGWRSDVATQLKKCVQCVQYHRGKPPKQTPLQPFLAGEPFEIIAIDVTGKHPRSSRGNEYIVTITDLFSKWSEAYPVKVHTAPVLARLLVNNFFSRFGTPKRILTDQGPEFESQLFHELCASFGIDKVRCSPYKPSTNGCVERFHRTLNSMLGKVISQNQRDWDEKLQHVMAAYRAAKHESTGFSPNRLIFGRENAAPLDLVLGETFADQEHYHSYDDYVAEIQDRIRKAHILARQCLSSAAERRKNEYDVRVKSSNFVAGQWVWYLYPRRRVNENPKWNRHYQGPFLITAVIPPSDYVIQRTRRSVPQVVHGDKLKACYSVTPESWLTTSTVPTGESPNMVSGTSFSSQKRPSRLQTRRHSRQNLCDSSQYGFGDVELDEQESKVSSRPIRTRKRPAWMDDFQS